MRRVRHRVAVRDGIRTQWRGTFATHTENMYGIEHLRCDGADCPAYDLPADNTSASWLKDGRLEQGRFIIDDGNKVGLAGPDGELLKEAER